MSSLRLSLRLCVSALKSSISVLSGSRLLSRSGDRGRSGNRRGCCPPGRRAALRSFPCSRPMAVKTPAPGVRMAEPSSSVKEPVPITAPEVGTPTSLPRPRARKPSGNISASLAERSFCSTTMGPKKAGTGALHFERIAASRDLVGFALVENLEQFLIDASAAVEALVDDQRLLVLVLEQVALELGERGGVHRLDVQIADFTVGQFGDHLLAVFHPAVVFQVALRDGGERFEIDGPGAVGCGFGVHQEFELAARKNVEELPVVVAGLQFLAVDRKDEVAGGDLDVIVIGRTFAVDVGDLVEAAGIGLEVEARVAGRDALPRAGPVWAGACRR